MTVALPLAPLYASRPFGVDVLPFDLRSRETLGPLYRAGPFDLALVPGDNRFSWLALAMRSLKSARLLVCPDTGIAHLGRITGTPTIALFGPGSSVVSGPGAYWRDSPLRAVTVEPFACRDQTLLFKREIAWVRRCGRSTEECASPRCMQAIEFADVRAAMLELIQA